ncbi:hypothetical protein CHUAL_001866 [Chamberlinius hualienensis]
MNGSEKSERKYHTSKRHLPRPVSVSTRKKYTTEQLVKLEAVFKENHHPESQIKKALADDLGVSNRHIQIWFQNRRSRESNNRRKAAGCMEAPIEKMKIQWKNFQHHRAPLVQLNSTDAVLNRSNSNQSSCSENSTQYSFVSNLDQNAFYNMEIGIPQNQHNMNQLEFNSFQFESTLSGNEQNCMELNICKTPKPSTDNTHFNFSTNHNGCFFQEVSYQQTGNPATVGKYPAPCYLQNYNAHAESVSQQNNDILETFDRYYPQPLSFSEIADKNVNEIIDVYLGHPFENNSENTNCTATLNTDHVDDLSLLI